MFRFITKLHERVFSMNGPNGFKVTDEQVHTVHQDKCASGAYLITEYEVHCCEPNFHKNFLINLTQFVLGNSVGNWGKC